MIKSVFVTLMGFAFLIVSSVSVLSAVHGAAPSEGEIVLKTLLDGGIITQQQYDRAVERIKSKAADGDEWRKHVDKHITHMEKVTPKFIDGLSVAGGITMVGQGTLGNNDNDPPGEDVIDGNASADIEIATALGERGEAFILIEAGAGEGVTDELELFWGINADAGDSESRLELTEAWYEHRFLDDSLAFTIGKINLTNYFDGNDVANDETTQFLSDGFVNNIAVEFPDNSAGARLTFSPGALVDLSLGAQSGDSDWEDILDKPFLMAEADVKPKFGQLQGNYRIYAWTNRSDHTELKDTSNNGEHGFGFGISVNQQVQDALTLFGRLGYQDRTIYEFDIAWSGGLSLGGTIWGREHDVFAIAYGQAILSNDYEEILDAQGISAAHEGHLEAYYLLMINKHVSLSPDIQVITNASGDGDFQTVTVGGLRGQFTF